MKGKVCLYLFIVFLILNLSSIKGHAQCAICTRTVQQMGDKPGKAFNAGIVYLAFTPLAIAGVLGYRWWKQNRGY